MSDALTWRKRGRIFCPSGQYPWLVSHASVPVAQPAGGSRYLVYFAGRDAGNRSHTGRFTMDLDAPSAEPQIDPVPLLSPGEPGAFDDAGAMPSWLVTHAGRQYLFYIGWNLGVTVPFRNAVGLAVSDDDGRSFARYSQGPILDRDPCDPFFIGSVCVLIENDTWRMWYLSCTGWMATSAGPIHRYHIKYAESRDGVSWQRTGIVAIDFASASEYAIARPSVVKDEDGYRMWYSYRGAAYRIGCAESSDGVRWHRRDQHTNLDAGPEAWDSEMVEYPFVFDHGGRRHMLYNGNGYGRTGIGLATLDRPAGPAS